jgi:hypothetical protein
MLAMAVAVSACSSVKNSVVKDMPIEAQEAVLKKYKDRIVWTRVVLQDLGEGGSISRDQKVRIIDVSMVFEGSVTVQTLQKKNKVRQGLNLERPLTPEKIDLDHEVFAGMPSEAALESWGKPAKVNRSELNGHINEQWVYPTPQSNKNRYIYFVDGKVGRWDE